MWCDTTGTVNRPLVVFSAPTKSPRQKVVIARGATQAATSSRRKAAALAYFRPLAAARNRSRGSRGS